MISKVGLKPSSAGEINDRDKLNETEESNRKNRHGIDERTNRQNSDRRSLVEATRSFRALIADVMKVITERSPC